MRTYAPTDRPPADPPAEDATAGIERTAPVAPGSGAAAAGVGRAVAGHAEPARALAGRWPAAGDLHRHRDARAGGAGGTARRHGDVAGAPRGVIPATRRHGRDDPG